MGFFEDSLRILGGFFIHGIGGSKFLQEFSGSLETFGCVSGFAGSFVILQDFDSPRDAFAFGGDSRSISLSLRSQDRLVK